MDYKFGRLPPLFHPNTLKFEAFLSGPAPVPDPPRVRAWEYQAQIIKAGWGMYDNDKKSDCTLASKAHLIMAATANVGMLVVPALDEIVGIYDRLSPDDSGLAMTTVYDYWSKNPIAGQKLLGWVQIDHTNRTHFQQCIDLFGACDVGVFLTQSAIDQFEAGQSWDVIANPGAVLGGHDVPYLGAGSQGETCISYGKAVPTGIPWFQTYAEEGYGLILDGWFDTAGKTPAGFNSDALWNALKALKQ